MEVQHFPSQRGKTRNAPLPYTVSPIQLLRSDIFLFFRSLWAFPGAFLPLFPWRSGRLDELYPSARNLWGILMHGLLFVYQTLFLVSLPILVCSIPATWFSLCIALGIFLNYKVCKMALNGDQRVLVSREPVDESPGHEREHWFFLNGIAVGNHWLQSNIDQIGRTFGRRVTGIHNRTVGVIFDVIECLIQRDFCYATQDIRDAYKLVKEALLDERYDKVVLILHSQGGIEGGLVVDWLLDEMPHNLLRKLEVYTFGSAANHFNNPHQSVAALRHADRDDSSQAIRHIEHYANAEDFVSVWGVLNFATIPNRYMGSIFVRQGSGHQFNQHYLDNMFTLGEDGRVKEDNEFMDAEMHTIMDGRNSVGRHKVKDLSRLWQYRNGGSPDELTN
ncbi:hypothetical protein ASPZODRAFT_98731 [Penicilliopsis zonata CBS 506.65]|uniref:DUF676 domain-containing protein n=1 Tax=Penicilliopsis zonata CBS 506.65 TaxID=1073090 RepID=A0A1L9SF85_9EURO|nr:hypothetical protein ASPZODRAFT_98731 [Penicilliopsis zonata CBS 506.65]OJJ45812.1 hypothetical protein ASPZODRAFT_98731 [Penicilliopsis zonata CBS 506.65]